MSKISNSGDLIAVIGKPEQLRPILSAEFADMPGCAVYSEKIPYYADLSIRDNVQQLRMAMREAELPRFEALLEATGLQKKRGWAQPFRKDATGDRKLYGLFAAMLPRPELLLVYDLLAGMEAKHRETFAQLAVCYGENGGRLVFTAQSLKDVLRLELPMALWLPGEGGFRKTDTETVAAKCAEAGSPEQADALLKRMEAGEAW